MSHLCPKCRNVELETIPGLEQVALTSVPSNGVNAANGAGEAVANGVDDAGLSADEAAQVDETPIWPGPPLRCANCRGFFLPAARVVELAGSGGLQGVMAPVGSAPPGGDTPPDKRAGLCPIGHGILTRARVELEGTFYLDRCSHCYGIWFDPGEWRRLVGSPLLANLEVLWDSEYRRKIRAEEARVKYLGYLRRSLGDDLFGRLTGIAAELKEHPARSSALAYLQETLQAAEPLPVHVD